MITFARLLEQLELHKNSVAPEEDNRAMNIVRLGNEFRTKDQTSFWEEFISLCSNSDGLAELFGIDANTISKWPARIKELQSRIDTHANQDPNRKYDKSIIDTGDSF